MGTIHKILSLVFLFLITTISLWAPPAGAQSEKMVGEGEVDGMWITDPDIALGFREYDRIDVEVTVTSGGPIDVYILSERQWEKFEAKESFKPKVAKENTEHTTFTFENPDGGEYFLVIDNSDNPRDNDAQPTGDVYYTYTAPIEERHQEVTLAKIRNWGIFIAILIVVATIAVVLRIKSRN